MPAGFQCLAGCIISWLATKTKAPRRGNPLEDDLRVVLTRTRQSASLQNAGAPNKNAGRICADRTFALTCGHTYGITHAMSAAKVAISIDQRILRHVDSLVKHRVFRSRSEAIQKAVEEKLGRLEKSRLARECAKLSRREEQAFAEAGLEADTREWPPY